MRRITLTLILFLTLLCCCNNKPDVESLAKKQAEKTMREIAKNPESISIFDMETIFKSDSVCVLHFNQRGQNSFGGYSIEKIEYMYMIEPEDKAVEYFVNLDTENSIYEHILELGMEFKSDGGLKGDINDYLDASIRLYTVFGGRRIER